MMAKVFSAVLILALLSACGAAAQTSSTAQVTCTIVGIAQWTNRVHVQCAQNPNAAAIIYFALPTTNTSVVSGASDAATRLVQMALTVWTNSSNSTLLILYDPSDTSTGPQYGCAATNCRPILAATVYGKTAAAPPVASDTK